MREQSTFTEFSKELVCSNCEKTYYNRNLRPNSKSNFCSKKCLKEYRKIELPENIVQEYLNGVSIFKLSKKYKVGQDKVSRFLKENKVEVNTKFERKSPYIYDFDKHNLSRKKVNPKVKNKEWLREKYIDERLNMLQISKILNCDEKTVWYYLKKFNIPRRERTEMQKGRKTPIEQRAKIKKHHWAYSKKREEIIEKSNTPDKINNRLSAILKPTSFEQKICKLCVDNKLPFQYTGDGRFIIGFKNPDFVNENDKVIIEVFLNYFKIRDYGSVENYMNVRSEYFAKYGYKTIFITEEEVCADNWEEVCFKKIKGGLKDERL